MPTAIRLLASTTTFLALSVPARADETRLPFSMGAFVDAVYTWNDNRPADHENFFPGVGTTAKRDNEFSINLAQVDLVRSPARLGFHLALGYGTGTDVVHAAEPDTWQHVVRASIQYQSKLGRGLLIEGGIFPSHTGFEGFASKDNWNYTRSWLGELSPYYQTGVKFAYLLGERWSTQLHILNGWQVISDTNRGKSLGWQFAYAGERLTFAANGIVGPELADNDRDVRALVDTVLIYKVSPSWSLGASIDTAREERSAADNVDWAGVALYARVTPVGQRTAYALRAEYFDDEDGAISGTAQTLKEVTLTFEHRPVEQLIVKFEGRYDRSNAPVFGGSNVDVTTNDAIRDEREQILLLISAVATF